MSLEDEDDPFKVSGMSLCRVLVAGFEPEGFNPFFAESPDKFSEHFDLLFQKEINRFVQSNSQ